MPRFIVGTIIAALLAAPVASAKALSQQAARGKGPTAAAAISAGRIVVRGRPYFPIMALGQCSDADVGRAYAAGIRLFMSGDCPSVPATAQLEMVEDRGLAVLPVASRGVRGEDLAGWTFPDEPENNHWSPSELAQAHPYRRATPDGLLSFMTTGSGFFGVQAAGVPPRSTYRDFAHLADVAGFDLYPLGHCHRDLVSVYDAQRDFIRLVGSMPTFQWIETGPIVPTYCGGFTMQPAELRAEVWLAIAGGARGIGYFTHTWSPEHKTFDVQPLLIGELQRTNAQLRRLTAGLLGQGVPASADSGAIKLVARRANGRVYVFAVNSTRDFVKAQLHVSALGDRRVTAYDESRVLQAQSGHLVDNFTPLAVHIYMTG
jgi:hypothetical protein